MTAVLETGFTIDFEGWEFLADAPKSLAGNVNVQAVSSGGRLKNVAAWSGTLTVWPGGRVRRKHVCYRRAGSDDVDVQQVSVDGVHCQVSRVADTCYAWVDVTTARASVFFTPLDMVLRRWCSRGPVELHEYIRQQDRLALARTTSSGHTVLTMTVMEGEGKEKKARSERFELDPLHGYLPMRSRFTTPDGALLMSMEADGRREIGQGWIARGWVVSQYKEGQPTMEIHVRTVRVAPAQGKAPDRLELPSGCTVEDFVSETRYKAGQFPLEELPRAGWPFVRSRSPVPEE